MNKSEIYFELKDKEDYIKINFIEILYPNAQLDWDRKWFSSSVYLKAGGFSGRFDCNFLIDEFIDLKQQLLILYHRLEGTAMFDAIEGQLKITIEGDGIGHFEAKCVAIDFAGTGNKLYFEMNFDQTIIPNLVKQIEMIEQYFLRTI